MKHKLLQLTIGCANYEQATSLATHMVSAGFKAYPTSPLNGVWQVCVLIAEELSNYPTIFDEAIAADEVASAWFVQQVL